MSTRTTASMADHLQRSLRLIPVWCELQFW
jgi:hypothetical protein